MELSIAGCSGAAYQPRALLLQWHVTERCNLRCAHCYQEGSFHDELPFDSLLDVLGQYLELLRAWRKRSRNCMPRGHITVTGGEPFVRRDFLDLLDVFNSYRREFSFAILTNGSLIDADLAKRLRSLRPAFVQVSIEGSRITHDGIRGPGNFDRTVESIELLTRNRIRSLISFTAHRANFREFPIVARLGRRLGVSRVWADRLIPCGNGTNLRNQLLTPQETREFFQIMLTERRKAARRWFCRTSVAMHRALQFLIAGTTPYHCTAGDSLITVQPDGDVLPCRRMPIRVGNLQHTPLYKLYYESDVLQALRTRDRVSNGCRDCLYKSRCRGGLKCLSYAVEGDPFAADPGCWLADNEDHEASASRGRL